MSRRIIAVIAALIFVSGIFGGVLLERLDINLSSESDDNASYASFRNSGLNSARSLGSFFNLLNSPFYLLILTPSAITIKSTLLNDLKSPVSFAKFSTIIKSLG